MTRRICTVCFGLLLVSAAVRGQERPMLLKTDRGVALLEEGRGQLLALRLDEAETTFDMLAQELGGRWAAAYHHTLAALIRGMLTDEERYFDDFFARSDALLELLAEAPDGYWRDYLDAEARLQRTMAATKQNRNVRAAMAGKSAYKAFNKAAASAPNGVIEHNKGLGLLHIAVATTPRSYRWLLRLFGFTGTHEQGMRELRVASEKSRFNREEALIFLSLIDVLYHGSRQGSLKRLAQLYELHPESPLFAHLYGFALLSNRQADKAERLLRQAAAATDDPDVFPIPFADYYLGDVLFKQARYEEAAYYLSRYLEHYEGPSLRAVAHLQLGLTLEMIGRRDAAVMQYDRVGVVATPSESDQAAVRRAAYHAATPLTPTRRRLIEGRGAYEAGAYADAVAHLRAVHAHPGASADERAEALLVLGRVAQSQGRYREALEAYEGVIAAPGEEAAGRAPWAQLYRGEVLEALGQVKPASEAYEAALAYESAFDFALSLEQSAKAALERVPGEG